VAEGTSFEIALPVVGAAGVESAAAAVDALANRLTATKSAASAAAAAVKEGESAYAASERAADGAAKALERIGMRADEQRGKLAAAMEVGDMKGAEKAAERLSNLVDRQAEVAAKADQAKSALSEQAAALDALRADASAADSAHAALTQASAQLEKQSLATAKAQEKSAEAAARTATEMRAAARGTQDFAQAGQALGKLGGPVGKLSQKVGGLTKSWKDLGKSLGAAGPYAAAAAGIAVITTAVIVGVAALAKWAIGMADSARGTKEIDQRIAKLKKNLTELFAGPKIQGAFTRFLDKLDTLGELFDATSSSGKAMRVVADDLFGGLIDGATGVIPKVRSAFIQFQILILKALIAIKPYGSTIVTVFKTFAIAIGVVIGVIAVLGAIGMAIFWGLVAVLWGTVKVFTAAATAVGQFASSIWDTVVAAVEKLKGMSLSDIGKALLDGLIAGILGAGPALIKSLTGVVDGAIGAAKKALGIASPSKVFAEIGANTAEGMTGGVEDNAGEVEGALEKMVAPPAAESGDASGASAGGGGAGGNTYNITVNAPGGDAGSIVGEIRSLLEQIEGGAIQLGLAVPNA
jgi:hypothetical protein